jgi:DUF1365 family protein
VNSSLYNCTVMHHRLQPKDHRFVYRIFLWCLDLDEIPALASRLLLFSHNRRNLFSFRETDHLSFGGASLKEGVIAFAQSHGERGEIAKILLVTHLRTMGHLFNPVSFYFCTGPGGELRCAIAEVGNTFGEMKPFFIPASEVSMFRKQEEKLFYVSPFVHLQSSFEFRLAMPAETLKIAIDDREAGKKFLATTLTGPRRELTNLRLLLYSVRFPLITLQVIGKIHWQALRLWLKGIPYHKKTEHPHLQQGIRHAHH